MERNVSGGNAPAAAPRFPGEDGGRSLAEIAQNDLDAALQLLADRAQYITGASGAAIALRRGEHADMLCRASAGSNAPELGSLLSMEYGLSGESVRTRQALLCDDTELDPRVNREGCRELGIASVIVMPVVSDGQVLGVFELFSGKPRAFDERDLSALQRLSEMVETAVKHAAAAQAVPPAEEMSPAEAQAPMDESIAVAAQIAIATSAPEHELVPAPADEAFTPPTPDKTEPEKTIPHPAAKKALFWSAPVQTPASVSENELKPSITVPPVLRNLQKCQACGFPVSRGRKLCVECEEKQWRGQQLPQMPAGDASSVQTQEPVREQTAVANLVVVASLPSENVSAPLHSEPTAAETSVPSSSDVNLVDPRPNLPNSDNSAPFLSTALPSESWFAANKYMIVAFLAVFIVIGLILWLR